MVATWVKTLLHMVALSVATRTKGELHDYYLRKVAGGKNKMLVINAVRIKLVMRMFAVIKNNNFYEKNMRFACKNHKNIGFINECPNGYLEMF
jgi:hypothetical protein